MHIHLYCHNPVYNHYYLDNDNFNKLYEYLYNNEMVDIYSGLKQYIIKFNSFEFYKKEFLFNNQVINTLRLPTSNDSKLGYFISKLINDNIIILQNIQKCPKIVIATEDY